MSYLRSMFPLLVVLILGILIGSFFAGVGSDDGSLARAQDGKDEGPSPVKPIADRDMY